MELGFTVEAIGLITVRVSVEVYAGMRIVASSSNMKSFKDYMSPFVHAVLLRWGCSVCAVIEGFCYRVFFGGLMVRFRGFFAGAAG